MKLKYFIWVFLLIVSITLVGCDKVVGKVNKKSQRSEEEIKVYVDEQLRMKYGNLRYTIVSEKKRNVSECKGSIDGSCFKREVISDAYVYTFNCVTSDGVEFYVNYTDPYTKKGTSYPEQIEDSYHKVMEDANINRQLESNLPIVLRKLNISGEVVKLLELNSLHHYAITIDISNIDKLPTLVQYLNSYIETVDTNKEIHYYIFLSDSSTINDIRNIINRTKNYKLNDTYKVNTLYKNQNTIDINNTMFNTYKTNNNSKYAIFVYSDFRNKKNTSFGYEILELNKK